MNNINEIFDTWAKSQKEFLAATLKSQEEFRSYWQESMRTMQDSLLGASPWLASPQNKDVLQRFNSWLSIMMKSYEVFAEDAIKIQNAWANALEHQMEFSRELAKSFPSLFKQP